MKRNDCDARLYRVDLASRTSQSWTLPDATSDNAYGIQGVASDGLWIYNFLGTTEPFYFAFVCSCFERMPDTVRELGPVAPLVLEPDS